jgi:hypothetical protein
MTDGPFDDHVTHDPADSSTATSTRVVRCVSDALDCDPLDLPPLYDAVDPDALDALVPWPSRGRRRLSFRFAGVEVHVAEAGDVRVVPTNG